DEDPSQSVEDIGSLRPECLPDSALFSPSSPLASEMPVSFIDPRPVPSADPPVLSEASGTTLESDAIRESDFPQPILARHSEESSQPEETSPVSSDAPSPFKVDLRGAPLSEPVVPARESESVSFPSHTASESVALVREAPPMEPSQSAVIPETPPAPGYTE